ncbi:hypothetical protein [Helicobacter pylori]|uniref:hypothetical protein n=1 Tax=Helicobacter pylori TaxID=210 RepID=UPI001F177499|nr:hypothetical protein [Helicobacter pylori]
MPYFFNEYDLTKNANREEPERLRKQVISILMRTPKGQENLERIFERGLYFAWGIRRGVMLKNFKKAFFRALCLGALGLLGG